MVAAPRRRRVAEGAARLAVLVVLALSGCSAMGGGARDAIDAAVIEMGMYGAKQLQEGDAVEAARAFQLAVRLQPTRWMSHYSLGLSLSKSCRCSRALVALARARALLGEHGETAALAAVFKDQATAALPIAQVTTNSSRQLQMLEFVASSLEQAFTLRPEPQNPLFDAVRKARAGGHGALHSLLLVTSGAECAPLMRAQAADAVSQGLTSKGLMLYNRAREVEPDSPGAC